MTDYMHYKMLIDGQWVPASDGAKFNSLNPTTGRVWATVPEATAEDVDRAVRAADAPLTKAPGLQCLPLNVDIACVGWRCC